MATRKTPQTQVEVATVEPVEVATVEPVRSGSSTFASRLAARKAVQDGENKAVKGSETK